MKYVNQERFIGLCCRVGETVESAQVIWDGLQECYSEEHRKYHNFTHIERMLHFLDESSDGEDAIELAIWFHDCVYDPLAANNEEQSARYFKKSLGTKMSKPLVKNVVRLILATKLGASKSEKIDEQLLVDIDLAILGACAEDYEVYRSAIRHEFAIVCETDFVAGRKRVLESFLTQKIYTTDCFLSLEKQARKNIKREIECLNVTRISN